MLAAWGGQLAPLDHRIKSTDAYLTAQAAIPDLVNVTSPPPAPTRNSSTI